MKAKRFSEISILFFLLILCISCKKVTQLPISLSATVTSLTSYSFNGVTSVEMRSNYFLITSVDKSNSIQIWVNNVSPSIGTTYTLGSSSSVLGTAFATYNTDFETDATHKGSIIFTKFDVSNHKISGTFNFKAIDQLSSIVTVSNGQFTDISWP